MTLDKIICCCCGRQIIGHGKSSDQYSTYGPALRMIQNDYICKECSIDLDENGLFPEEREGDVDMKLK